MNEKTVEEENDKLRHLLAAIILGIAESKCHYCGLSDVSKCAHGFPGCPLMDDLMLGTIDMEEEPEP